MNITNAKYVDSRQSGTNDGIDAVIDEVLMHVPISEDNRHYREIMKQVADGDLTIADAD
jgi:hypothetical protein